MNDLSRTPIITEDAEPLATKLKRASSYPFSTTAKIPSHGFYRDPETGTCYSGGMEIAPLEKSL